MSAYGLTPPVHSEGHFGGGKINVKNGTKWLERIHTPTVVPRVKPEMDMGPNLWTQPDPTH